MTHFIRMILLALEFSVCYDARCKNMESVRRGMPSPVAHLNMPAGSIPFDDRQYRDLLEFVPDKLNLCNSIVDWTCGDLRHALVISPFILSCMTCMVSRSDAISKKFKKSMLKPAGQTSFLNLGRHFLRKVLAGETDDDMWDGFAPQPAHIYGDVSTINDEEGIDAD